MRPTNGSRGATPTPQPPLPGDGAPAYWQREAEWTHGEIVRTEARLRELIAATEEER